MQTVLLNVVVAAAALVLVYLVWGGVHLLARRRIGERQLGCKGPVPGENGQNLCCRGDGSLCEDHGKEHRHD